MRKRFVSSPVVDYGDAKAMVEEETRGKEGFSTYLRHRAAKGKGICGRSRY